MVYKLAIIIPAYKAKFFHQALESIAKQTCKDFTLYIGDDAGPDDIKRIADEFKDKINLVYWRFDTNLGQYDLAKQWERCVELTGDEEFIWLFSDDDIMPDNAVKLFYTTIENNNNFDLYRFNIRQIDENGLFISESTNHPEIESAENFIYRRLKGETLSAACEYIFSRNTFKKTGGFVNFPMAWCTDDASWYLFGKDEGICTIQGAPVFWRITEENISAPGTITKEKYRATLLFLSWLKKQNISDRVSEIIPFGLKRQSKILNVNLWMYLNHIFDAYKLIGLRETIRMAGYIMKRRIM